MSADGEGLRLSSERSIWLLVAEGNDRRVSACQTDPRGGVEGHTTKIQARVEERRRVARWNRSDG